MNRVLEDKEYIKEIYSQITKMGGFKLMSWGPSQFLGVIMNDNPTLQFKVQGQHFKGHVRIELDRPRDAYNIHFGKFVKKSYSWTNKKTEEYVYFDQMVDIIDTYVEK